MSAVDIREGVYRDQAAVLLENDVLQVAVLPKRGGKTASIFHKALGFELLFQSPQDRGYPPLEPGIDFALGDSSGFDDCFPSIVPEKVQVGGRTLNYPDHGEVWTLPFAYTVLPGVVQLITQGRLLPYAYEKTVRLDGGSVHYEYCIENKGDQVIPCVWTCHCLVAMHPGMRFVYPVGCNTIENVLGGILGAPGEFRNIRETGYDLTALPKTNPPGMTKFYFTKPCPSGECGYCYPAQGVAVQLTFGLEELPYLGMWQTLGGYRGDFNCALEPSSGYYDSLSKAKKSGTVKYLAPGERWHFSLCLKLARLDD